MFCSITCVCVHVLQIRKIARKYKLQYEELKALEDEKKKLEEKTAEAAQEGAMDTESRKELEQRLMEAESRHTDKLKELNEQVMG